MGPNAVPVKSIFPPTSNIPVAEFPNPTKLVIPISPPTNAMMTIVQNETDKLIIEFTPTTIEKPITSGIRTSTTTTPANIYPFIFENHSS